MYNASYDSIIIFLLHILVQLIFIVRVMLRPHRQPASRIAWVVVILVLPIAGILLYVFFGEVNIGRRHIARLREVINDMPDFPTAVSVDRHNHKVNTILKYQPLFCVGQSISHFEPVAGNSARLMANSNAAIDAMVVDIDNAEYHVHVLFYIWLTDNNGLKIVNALIRAAARGVVCRAMADDLGSRVMIHSGYWQSMQDAGVHTARALPVGNPLLRPFTFTGRIDLRNHRKIVVIDSSITYCGSQNCADPEFRVKPKYAPWVDVMMRFEGPIAMQNQYLFASDWMTYVDEDIHDLLKKTISISKQGFPAQVIATGPTVRFSAMPEMFESLMYAAKDKLVISTPYYVPDEAMQNAICAAAYRGVDTSIIFPARNDSWMVAAASRSYYAELLSAGVKIYEYEDGLLHAKTLTMDGEIVLIGSANMDRRSFELNYENNILLYDPALSIKLRQRQQEYIDHSHQVFLDDVIAWPMSRHLVNNTIAMLGPLF